MRTSNGHTDMTARFFRPAHGRGRSRICCLRHTTREVCELGPGGGRNPTTPEAQLRSLSQKFALNHQRFIRSVRAVIRKRLPTANELVYDYSSFFVIGYSPTDRGIDAVVSIAARADRVDLYFNQGPQLPDPKKLLRGSGKQTRFVQVTAARQLAHPDMEAFITAAIERASVPLPFKGKGILIVKTNKAAAAAKKQPRRKPTK